MSTSTDPWMRVRLTGRLVVKSDLHLGDGRSHESRFSPDRAGEPTAEVAAVARDAKGRPYLPGSSLKGALRGFLVEALGFPPDNPEINRLFGRGPKPGLGDDALEADRGEGGRVDFLSAYPADPNEEIGVREVARVGIDRVTRMAADRLLFAADWVPTGSGFALGLVGHGLTDGEISTLLLALEGFNDPWEPIRLGGGRTRHRGRAAWTTTAIERTTSDRLRQWLDARTPGPWTNALEPVADAARDDLVAEAVRRRDETRDRRRPKLIVALRLDFPGALLVNDPRRCKGPDGKPADEPSHAARLTSDDRPILPSSSARGAIRSQAERIARTLNDGAIGDPHRDRPRADQTYPLDRLFGATDRASAIEFDDFLGDPLPTDPAERKKRLVRQTSVAIDRFTGGVADGKLFTSEYLWKPSLKGQVHVPLDERVPPALLGLLVLTARDLVEGDISFGMGAGKHFGTCRAAITGFDLIGWDRLATEGAYQDLCALLEKPAPGGEAIVRDWLELVDANAPIAQVLRKCVERLRNDCKALAAPVASNGNS